VSANERVAVPGIMAPRRPALCVSIHDVAPATWDDCRRLHDAVRAVADIPLTWLVIPRYRHRRTRSAAMEAYLEAQLATGHELALHGFTHRDDGPGAPSRAWLQHWTRTVFAGHEGEFAALDESQARARIALGRAWFEARSWPLSGFVAPAWLLGPGAWRALAQGDGEDGRNAPPFRYTTTLARFHWLQSGETLWAPSLVYTARNRAGRVLSPCVLDASCALQREAPLVRLSLHPHDAHHPALLRHMQRTMARLLATRQALTKADFADSYQYGPQKPPPRQRPGP
jgi:predicted deacetylase